MKEKKAGGWLAAVSGAVLIFAAAGGAGLTAQAAAPGSAEYTQAVNRAIMYTEGVYEEEGAEPMSLSESIACAFADARPDSTSVTYAGGNTVHTTNYSWNGTFLTSRSDVSDGYSIPEVWTYTWNANGFLDRVSSEQKTRYFTNTKNAALSYQMGEDGKLIAYNAPSVYYWEARSTQRVYGVVYDSAGRISAIAHNLTDLESGETAVTVSQYVYNPNGTLMMVLDADNAHYEVFHYDEGGRLAMSFDEYSGGHGDTAVAYGYDAANRPNAAASYREGELWYQQGFHYNY